MYRLSIMLAVSLFFACSERDITVDGPTDEDQAPAAGGMWAACDEDTECTEVPYCAYPADESGFCTRACADPGNVSTCGAPDSGTAELVCVDLRETSVCALDCDDGRACPAHMRCQQVALSHGARWVCF